VDHPTDIEGDRCEPAGMPNSPVTALDFKPTGVGLELAIYALADIASSGV
jgi:hypothetical protein